jgi:hypothetical protein
MNERPRLLITMGMSPGSSERIVLPSGSSVLFDLLEQVVREHDIRQQHLSKESF